MKELKYTLIADGSSDVVLLKIIKWSLDNLFPLLACEGRYADFRKIPNPPKRLTDKTNKAKYYYPYDVLFIHRDAESTNNPHIIDQRREEIWSQIDEADRERTIAVVPIKMMETWLLFDVEAIKKAAGNRNYRGNINLPTLRALERENQPKELLHSLLREASGKSGRHLKHLNVDRGVHLVADNIEDYSPLRNLVAFQAFEEELKKVVNRYLES